MAGRMERIRWAELGGYAIALAGLMAIVCIAAAPGAPYVISMAVMGLALTPVMLGFYELGGRASLRPARVALTIGVAAVLLFAAMMISLAVGLVTFDETRPAQGAFAITAICMLIIGFWLVAATALAGQWLTPGRRWFGFVCGLGFGLAGIGLLLGGSQHSLTTVGGIGYQLLFPIWGVLIGRRFRTIRSEATASSVAASARAAEGAG
jgi:hypothetical protein